MIPETVVMWTALGANAVLMAKLFAFKLQFDRLPAMNTPEIVDEPDNAIHSQLYSAPRRVPHHRKPELACVTLPKAVDLLIDWLNGQGLSGIHASSEIDTYWQTACIELDLQPIDVRFIREGLDGRGLRIGKKRLNSPEYSAIRQRTGKDRLVLFRIPRTRAGAGTIPEAPATTPDFPALIRPLPGTVPGIAEKPCQIRRAA